MVSRTDRNGNSLTYGYTGALLTQVTTQDGEYTSLIYSGNNLVQLSTHLADGTSLSRTYYTYDGRNRLSKVSVDLTPTDNSITDGNVYTTTYTYLGTTKQVASIRQTDGSRLDIAYDASGRVSSYTQWVDATTNRVTTFSYDTVNNITTITDNQGNSTALSYDANGNLLSISTPPAVAGSNQQIVGFNYDGNGNLLSAKLYDGSANALAQSALTGTTYTYDANGNVTQKQDLQGDISVYTYNNANQLLTSTQYTGTNYTIAPHTGSYDNELVTRYAYDAQGVDSRLDLTL